jgi:hypothetical protein
MSFKYRLFFIQCRSVYFLILHFAKHIFYFLLQRFNILSRNNNQFHNITRIILIMEMLQLLNHINLIASRVIPQRIFISTSEFMNRMLNISHQFESSIFSICLRRQLVLILTINRIHFFLHIIRI